MDSITRSSNHSFTGGTIEIKARISGDDVSEVSDGPNLDELMRRVNDGFVFGTIAKRIADCKTAARFDSEANQTFSKTVREYTQIIFGAITYDIDIRLDLEFDVDVEAVKEQVTSNMLALFMLVATKQLTDPVLTTFVDMAVGEELGRHDVRHRRQPRSGPTLADLLSGLTGNPGDFGDLFEQLERNGAPVSIVTTRRRP